MSNGERLITTFNSAVEVGLRALVLLNDIFPHSYSLHRLVILDYFAIHSDDLPQGPQGLHPQTPHRSGEILVRRSTLQDGLMLFHSRGLIDIVYLDTGVEYSASERSSSFLDSLDSEYVAVLRDRSAWLQANYASSTDAELQAIVRDNIGVWGAEFEMASVLTMEDLE
jgi:hypothetical protein